MLTTIVQRTIRIKFSRRFLYWNTNGGAVQGSGGSCMYVCVCCVCCVCGSERGSRDGRRGVNRFIAVLQRRNYCSGFPSADIRPNPVPECVCVCMYIYTVYARECVCVWGRLSYTWLSVFFLLFFSPPPHRAPNLFHCTLSARKTTYRKLNHWQSIGLRRYKSVSGSETIRKACESIPVGRSSWLLRNQF